MKNKALAYPLIAISVIILVTLACGGSSSGEKVGETTSSSATSAPPTVEMYKIGDIIKAGDHTITLNSAEFQGNLLKANFTIENQGSTDLNVSSMLSFEAKDSEGTKLEQELFDCGTGGLDGKVLPGDKLKGNICWKGATTDTIKIYYSAELFGSGAIVWEVSK